MNEFNNNSDKKNQNILKKYIDLLNSLILSLKNKPLNDLQELSEEFTIFSFILEIEPNFEKIPFNNKVELFKDSNLENRYNNFNSIFTAVVNYKNESKTKDKFTKETNFTKTININDLLNNVQDQLLKIAEMLCFLTIISSNKNYFIEKVNEIEDNQISNLYYSIIEKYITFKIDESISSIVKKTNIFSNQVQNVKTYNLKADIDKKYINDIDIRELTNIKEEKTVKVVKPTKELILSGYDNTLNDNEERDNNRKLSNNNDNDDFENEKEKFMLKIKVDNLTKEILNMKENFKNLEKDKKILEDNINELRDINYKLKEKYSENEKNFEEKNKIENMKIELNEAYQIIENLKNENDQLHKIIEKINNEKENVEIQLKSSEDNLQNLIIENEKMKKNEKIKEKVYNENILNNKNIIDKLKEDLNNQIKINEKMKDEKEIMQLEIEKYKIEINNKENNNIKNNQINYDDELKNEIQKLKNNLEEKDKKIKKLEEINAEKDKDKGEDINFYKKSYEEQKIRVNEEHKLISESLYKLAIHFMTLKDDLQKRINSSNSDK